MKILIVDDEEIGRDSLRTLLETCNYEVQTAENGPQAIRQAENFRPEVVIIDWLLGHEMDGMEVATQLTAIHPATRIIIVSGDIELAAKIPDVLRCDCLSKPFQLAELLDKLKPL